MEYRSVVIFQSMGGGQGDSEHVQVLKHLEFLCECVSIEIRNGEWVSPFKRNTSDRVLFLWSLDKRSNSWMELDASRSWSSISATRPWSQAIWALLSETSFRRASTSWLHTDQWLSSERRCHEPLFRNRGPQFTQVLLVTVLDLSDFFLLLFQFLHNSIILSLQIWHQLFRLGSNFFKRKRILTEAEWTARRYGRRLTAVNS